jgi:cysteine-rich repeat protein
VSFQNSFRLLLNHFVYFPYKRHTYDKEGAYRLTLTVEDIFGARGTTSKLIVVGNPEYCGDGILQSHLGEDCDDKNEINNDGCTSKSSKKINFVLSLNCYCNKFDFSPTFPKLTIKK